MVEIFWRQADSLVAHGDNDLAAVDVYGDGDPSLRRREFERVLEEIDERPLNLAGVEIDDGHLIR